MNELQKNINVNELSIEQQNIMKCVGKEKYIELCKMFGGNFIYIAKYENLQRQNRNQYIIDDYNNGLGYREIAIKYGLTSIWIRKIIQDSL